MKATARLLPKLEALEDRAMLSTCHVTRLGDSGGGFGLRGDLRYCISKVNENPGPDVIDFTVTGTINLNGALPDLASDIDIQGPGADLLTIDAKQKFRVFYITPGASVQISGLTMTQGRSERGAGIYNSGKLILRHSQVVSNRSAGQDIVYGAGIYNTAIATLTVSESTIAGNVVDSLLNYPHGGYGGGIYNLGTATVVFSTISENLARGRGSFPVMAEGGGISNEGNLTVLSSTISGNQVVAEGSWGFGSVYDHGGGIANSGTAMISNSTIAGNLAFVNVLTDQGVALSQGGGIYSSGTLTLANSTVAGNDASRKPGTGGAGQGGGIFGSGFSIRNTILAGNSASGSYLYTKGPDLCGFLTSSGHNLIGDTSCGRGYDDTDLLDINPLMGLLTDNGGPTQTFALLPGSPAIEAGDNTDAPEWDQRGPGFLRVVNDTIDIGAFEVQGTGAPNAHRFLAVLSTANFESETLD